MRVLVGRRHLLALGVAVTSLTLLGHATRPAPPVVVISIDGLRPDHVTDADRLQLRVPHLRRLMREGAWARGVRGVLPTLTYPSHTTLVTGVRPERHGIRANSPFDPLGHNGGGWYWYAEDVHAPTLWDRAAAAGLVTASVDWPVSVGAPITYNIVQYWRASAPDDSKLLRALSTPGLLAEAERALGPYPAGTVYTPETDQKRAAFSAWLLRTHRPRLHACYLSALDEQEHASGPFAARSLAVLEQLDGLVGQIRAAAEESGDGSAVVTVVSDHGFVGVDRELHVNAALRAAGLIDADASGALRNRRALAWIWGGSAAVMLKDPADAEARRKAAEVLATLAKAGEIDRVVASGLGAEPQAAFVISLPPGSRFGYDLDLPVARAVAESGSHGLLPDAREMDAAFFIAGPGIPARDLGRIDMTDVAPTLAARLGLELPTAEGRDVLASR
jgi:arylsulfatase A-like enzyme